MRLKLKDLTRKTIIKVDITSKQINVFFENWIKVISDKYFMGIVKNELKLEFLDETPHCGTFTILCSAKKDCIILQDIDKILKKK